MSYKAKQNFGIVGKGFSEGEEINEAELGDAVDALLDSGLIEPTTKKAKEKE